MEVEVMERSEGSVERRPLGRTGETVSALGVGGFHLSQPHVREDLAIRIVRSAIDAGIDFMDNSWDYADGESERRMGKALKDGYRDRVFLMTKIDGRSKRAAREQLEESLRRLAVDRIDLVQHHELIRMEGPDRIFRGGGAQEALLEARDEGLIRFIGFTGHKDPLVHLRMLDVAEEHGFTFDAVQMPLNVMDAHFRSFEHHVLPRLVEQGIGVLGMKSMADGNILDTGLVSAEECLRYAMSLDTSTVITGIDSEEILDQAIHVATRFQPLDEDERADILARTANAAREGRAELFKTSSVFDGTAQNPQWLGEEPQRVQAGAPG